MESGAVQPAHSSPGVQIRAADIVSALSYALDLTEGKQTMGKSVRTCLLGMRIARQLGLPVQEQTHLYYAMLLKDAGCSSNAARVAQIFGSDDLATKRSLRRTNWRRPSLGDFTLMLPHVAPGEAWTQRLSRLLNVALKRRETAAALVGLRCERGASIVRKMGFPVEISDAVLHLDEHWDGHGVPFGVKGPDIPVAAQIASLAQTLEAFATSYGIAEAIRVVRSRRKTWFNPELTQVLPLLERDQALWQDFFSPDVRDRVLEMDRDDAYFLSPRRLDDICEAFADVIDAKTHYTYEHSSGVAKAAVAIARKLELAEETVTMLRRAALLHDIGKLGVSNAILEKPGKLTQAEWQSIREHPYYTQKILERIRGFEELTFVASAHHERLDGSGYFMNLPAESLPLPARILAVADVFDALHAERPYREALPTEKVFAILDKDAPHALDGDCVQALKEALG